MGQWGAMETTAVFREDYSAIEQAESRRTRRSVAGATIQVRDAEDLNLRGREGREKMKTFRRKKCQPGD